MSHADTPTLDHLRILAAVVEAGSFSAAARQLDRSQPAISYGIAALEEQLGLTLFERGRRKPTLTPAGLAVLSYARRMGQLADELAASASSLTAGLEGHIVVAIDTFFPVECLAAALGNVAETFPSVAFDVRVAPREQVLRLVVEGEAALGVSAVDIAWPPGVEARDFGSVEIVGRGGSCARAGALSGTHPHRRPARQPADHQSVGRHRGRSARRVDQLLTRLARWQHGAAAGASATGAGLGLSADAGGAR